jgi:hypothetical protein
MYSDAALQTVSRYANQSRFVSRYSTHGFIMVTLARSSIKKLIRARGIFKTEGERDVGWNGMSINAASPLQTGHLGKLAFDIFLNGKSRTIAALAKVVYCVCGDDGFKVELKFVTIDPAATPAMEEFMKP